VRIATGRPARDNERAHAVRADTRDLFDLEARDPQVQEVIGSIEVTD